MTKRTWVLLLILVVVLGSYWAYRNYGPALMPSAFEQPAPISYTPANHRAFPRPQFKPAPPMTLRQALAKIPHPHLQPDQRFLEAAAFVRDFPAEPSTPSVAADFKDGAWTISNGTQTLGQFPPYPDFTNAMTLLHAEVKQKAAVSSAACDSSSSPLASQVTVFDEKTLLDALYKLNKGYRALAPDPANVYLAAQALARLAYFEDDKTGTAGALYAKAMALVALAEGMCGRPMPEEESLLAASMGYPGAASKAADKSTVRDAWKLYVTRDDTALEQMARLNPDSKSAGYFWLRRLSDMDRGQDWLAWIKERYSGMNTPVYILDTDQGLSGHPPVELYAHYMPLLVLGALPGTENMKVAPFDPVTNPARAIQLFDEGLPYIKNVAGGPYLTATDVTVYYRGFFYTGLYEAGYYLLDLLDDLDAAKQYAQLLSSASGEAGQEFYQWYDAEVSNNQGKLTMPVLMQDMSTTKLFSRGLYYNAWSDTAGRTGEWNVGVHSTVWQMATLFDTRTDMRWDYGQILKWIADFPDYEEAFASLADQESRSAPSVSLTVYAYRGEVQKLLQVANDTALTKETRVSALADIPDVTHASQQIHSAYQGIIESYPSDSDGYHQYIQYLNDIEDYPGIEKVARTWLVSQSADDNSFSFDNATVSLADAQAKQGQLEQAWTTISQLTFAEGITPAKGQTAEIRDYYARVLAEASYVARLRKDFTLAEFLSRTEADRYPTNLHDQMPWVKTLWAEQRYADAADYLAKWPYPIAAWQWDHVIGVDIGTEFKTDTDAALKAFEAVINSQPHRARPFDLQGVVLGAGYSNPAVAFVLGQALSPPSMNPMNFQNMLQDYAYLKRAKGKDKALAWLKSSLPKSMTAQQQLMAITMYYGSGNYELLWDLVPDPGSTPHSDEIWLFRAAAYTQQAELNPDQKRALLDHFAKAGDGWYDQLGKYLLKQISEDAILDKPLDPHALSEASYYAAIRALSEQRYRQAQDWLQVDMDTNQLGNGEFIWGRELRSHWYMANHSLEVLAAKGELYKGND
jgi:hypothetical protein